jgi:hypothetical protein
MEHYKTNAIEASNYNTQGEFLLEAMQEIDSKNYVLDGKIVDLSFAEIIDFDTGFWDYDELTDQVKLNESKFLKFFDGLEISTEKTVGGAWFYNGLTYKFIGSEF